MGVDWGRDDGEYEYDDLDRPPDRRKRRQGADWDDRDWAPRDEPMGPEADGNSGPPPERPGYDEEQYRQEYTDRARSHHYRGGPMDEDAREKRLFQEAQWETRGQPRRAPAPQERGDRGSSGRWDQDVYERHKPPERNMAANEFYRMQDAEWREKQYEDPYRRKKKRPSAAGKWYRTEGERSRIARRQAHEPFVEKEKIILDMYTLPIGVKAIAIFQIIVCLIGLTGLAYIISIAIVIPLELVGLLILVILGIYAGIKMLQRFRFGYSYTIVFPWLVLGFVLLILSVNLAMYSDIAIFAMGAIFFCISVCVLPLVLYGMVTFLYLRQFSDQFKK